MNFLESEPDGFRAGFAVAIATEEATQARDQAQHLVGLGRLFNMSQQIRAANLVRIEEQLGIQLGTISAHAHQMGDTPRHHQEQRQGARAARSRPTAAPPRGNRSSARQQDLDFPAHPIPVDQFDRLRHRPSLSVGQQAPFDRLDAGRRVESAPMFAL